MRARSPARPHLEAARRVAAAPAPACSRIAAASAIMAPLSVHSASSRVVHPRTARWRSAGVELLAQRAVGADAAGDDQPPQARWLAARASTWRPARRRSPPASTRPGRARCAARRRRRRACGLRQHRGLQPRKREIEVAAVQQRARQREGGGVAELGQRGQRRAARIAQAEQLGGLVERLAGRVVDASRRAAHSGRRRRPASAACGRPRPAARRTESSAGRADRNGDSRCPSRWCTPSAGRSSAAASAHATPAPTSSAPASPGPRV